MSDLSVPLTHPMVRVHRADWTQLEADLKHAWGRPLDEWFRNRPVPFKTLDTIDDIQILSVGKVVFGDPPLSSERQARAGYDTRPMVLRSFCLDLIRVR